MNHARILPRYLVQRFHGWHATAYQQNRAWYRRLAESGQHPRAMIISCCDSRVDVSSVFDADAGEFFMHRNVAALVPPYTPDGQHHGTSAALEFAVAVLGVAHVIIVGHSGCGGVKGCLDMCTGRAPELEEKTNFTGRWMDLLRPGYEKIAGLPEEEQRHALEEQVVLTSLENLMTFPFVRENVERDILTLHGLWNDTGEGLLKQYDPAEGKFVLV